MLRSLFILLVSLAVTLPSAAAVEQDFEQVLDRIMGAFGHDAKKALRGPRRLALRKIAVPDHVPRAHGKYLEGKLTEALREVKKAKVVDCPPCRMRTAALVEGKLLVAAPGANAGRLDAAAEELGIDEFVDVVFLFQKTEMAMAVQVFDAKTKTLTWSRTYNSSTLSSRGTRLAATNAAIDLSRDRETYDPDTTFGFGLGGAAFPNVAGTVEDSTNIAAQLRFGERFAGRRDEFGVIATYYKTTSSIASKYPAEEPQDGNADEPVKAKVVKPIPKPFKQAYSLAGVYGLGLFGDPGNFDQPRLGAHGGLGFLAATGYLAGVGRLGVDALVGKRLGASMTALYVAPTTVRVGGVSRKAAGGAGIEMMLSFRY